MTCCVRRPPRRGRVSEVAGTWDFKWPLGKQIRVAFQRPPTRRETEGMLRSEAEFEEARQVVIGRARRWLEAIALELEADHRYGIGPAEFLRQGISLSFPEDLILEAPDVVAPVTGDEYRSPFLPHDPRRTQYDVLVSLEDLPVERIDPFRLSGAAPKGKWMKEKPGVDRITMPMSELGSYARRVDYGLPTMFLGRFGAAKNMSLLEYLATPLAAHVVVHEFGHVFGLPHEHQNPHYPDTFYRSTAEIRSNLVAFFGVQDHEVTEQDVTEHIIGRWSGAIEFSDWEDPRKARRSLFDLDSVMAYPFHRELLRPDLNPRGKAPLYPLANRRRAITDVLSVMPRRGTKDDSAELANIPPPCLQTQPTQLDVQNQIRMYCRELPEWMRDSPTQQYPSV